MSTIIFEDRVDFCPNLSPMDIMQLGSFGGGYYRDIYSHVSMDYYSNSWLEFPVEWFDNLDIETKVCSNKYLKNSNKYKIKCGSSLSDWENNGWIVSTDPYGWFQWYCRFYLGRRTDDDDRQIRRFNKCAGLKGRWKINLCNKIIKDSVSNGRTLEESLNNYTISPGIRQTLQHWGYVLTYDDLIKYKKLNI
jgi:hypothetical protein